MITNIIQSVIIAALIFLGFAFGYWNIDPAVWDITDRQHCALSMLLIPMCVVFLKWFIKNSKP